MSVTTILEGTTEPDEPAAIVEPKRLSRKRIAFWSFLVVVGIVAIVIGRLTWQIVSTLGTVNSVSTPPSTVSGSSLGGSPEVQIDTGPARTAVALGQANPTRTPRPTTIASDLISTSTPVPTVERTGTIPNITADDRTSTPEPTPTITATATPEATVLSEIERVQNGSFEGGIAPWYLEDGAGPVVVSGAVDGQYALQIPAQGGYADQKIFFVPGTTYQLTAWGRVTASGDSGILGVVYLDKDGNRMMSQEPVPLSFNTTTFSEGVLSFTPPEEVSKVQVFAYKAEGAAALEIDAVSIRSVVEPYTDGDAVGEAPELSEGSMTILIMGVDAREGEAIDGEVRPDSLMVVHLNPTSDSCRVLSIPRDTRTDLPGYGMTKINHALAVGGIEYEVQVVSNLIDIPIDHYVLVDFAGFEDLVNAIGGITVNVPEPFVAVNGMEFTSGQQRFNGKQALSYARHRGDLEGDFGRIKRQQQIIRALIAETGSLDILTSINELLPAISENLRTDLGIAQMIEMASTYRSICTEDAITLLSLEGYVATYDDPLLLMPLSYVVVDEAEIHNKIAALLEP